MRAPGEERAASLLREGEDVAGALDGLRGRFPDVAESDVAAVGSAWALVCGVAVRAVPARAEGR